MLVDQAYIKKRICLKECIKMMVRLKLMYSIHCYFMHVYTQGDRNLFHIYVYLIKLKRMFHCIENCGSNKVFY